MTHIDLSAVEGFARRYAEAWCSQDASRVASFFAPNGSLRVNDTAPAVGRAAITDVAQGFMTTFPDMRVLMDGLEADGPRFTFRWTLIGTHTGPASIGRAVRLSGLESWRMSDDGLIAESQGHFDAEEYQRQLQGG